MKNRLLVTLILTLALAAANAAPLLALVTCGMSDAPGSCSCAHDACCPQEAPAGPGFEAACCSVTVVDGENVDAAPVPPSPAPVADASLPAIDLPNPEMAADPAAPVPARDAPRPPLPPPYRLHCSYLI